MTSTKFDDDVNDEVGRIIRSGFEELEGAWIITNGFNAGASKAVGEIMSKIRESTNKTELEIPVIGVSLVLSRLFLISWAFFILQLAA